MTNEDTMTTTTTDDDAEHEDVEQSAIDALTPADRIEMNLDSVGPDGPEKAKDRLPDLVFNPALVMATATTAYYLGRHDAKCEQERTSFEVVSSLASRWLTHHREAIFAAYRVGLFQESAWKKAPAPGDFAVESRETPPEGRVLLRVTHTAMLEADSVDEEALRHTIVSVALDGNARGRHANRIEVERITVTVDEGEGLSRG